MATTIKKGLSRADIEAVMRVVGETETSKVWNDVNFLAFKHIQTDNDHPKIFGYWDYKRARRYPEFSRTGVYTYSSGGGSSNLECYMRQDNGTCTDEKWKELGALLLDSLFGSKLFGWADCYSGKTNSIALIREQARESMAKEERKKVEDAVKWATERVEKTTKDRTKAKTQKQIQDADYYLESAKESLREALEAKTLMDADVSDASTENKSESKPEPVKIESSFVAMNDLDNIVF